VETRTSDGRKNNFEVYLKWGLAFLDPNGKRMPVRFEEALALKRDKSLKGLPRMTDPITIGFHGFF
jgi:hypothetical protein